MAKDTSNVQTYYDVLKIKPGSDDEQVRRAYLKLASIYHPDKNPGNENATSRFARINEAYTELKTKNTRARYDRRLLHQSMRSARPDNDNTSHGSGTLWQDILGLFTVTKQEKR